MRLKIFIALMGLLNLSACASLIAPPPSIAPEKIRAGQYQLDPGHTALLFKVSHLGLSTFVGRFNLVEASLDFDATAPENTKLEGLIDINSLDVANDDFAKTLIGAGWFDGAHFPQARFIATSLSVTDENHYLLQGDFTLKGVTHPLDLTVTFNGGSNVLLTGKYSIGFEATGSFLRSDYGLDRYTNFVGDRVRIEFYGEFQRTAKVNP